MNYNSDVRENNHGQTVHLSRRFHFTCRRQNHLHFPGYPYGPQELS